jgi:hypothetical protein
MAQVISAPGQNQVFGNVAVASAISKPGPTQSTMVNAVATTVSYSQCEPGRSGDNNSSGKRS